MDAGRARPQRATVRHADHSVPVLQKLLEHAGETEAGVACPLLEYDRGQRGDRVRSCRCSFTTGSLATRDQNWTSFRCCCVDTASFPAQKSARRRRLLWCRQAYRMRL